MKLSLVMVILLLITLPSCTCEEYACPAFSSADAMNWLPSPSNSEFQDASGNRKLSLRELQRELSNAYGEEQISISFNCHQNDCFATANYKGLVSGAGDSLMFQVAIVNNFYGKKHVASKLNYTLGDMSGSFQVTPQLTSAGGDPAEGLLPDSLVTLNTGLTIYPVVMVQTRIPSPTYKVVKTYWVSGIGLIGLLLLMALNSL